MDICLIGPSHPFRGGVAHHTTLLYGQLRKKHHVTFYGFIRQYPRWLFPGKTDKDNSRVPLVEEGVENLLDPMNPITWWRVFRRIKKDNPALLIIPWWTSFWTPQFWAITTLVKRFSSTKVVFICHNIVDHESHLLSGACARAVLTKGDYFFVHSDYDASRLRKMLPSCAITRAFHPIYDFFKNSAPSKIEARARLGVEGDTILFFGFVRPYKGVDHLLEAMSQILEKRRVTLLVVGEIWNGMKALAHRIKELGLEEGSVRVIDQYVPNEEVGLYFCASDLVVLPYISATASGVIQIAYGFEKPVVATRVGCLPEVLEDGKTGYLVDPGDVPALAEAVIRFFAEQREAEFVENIRKIKDRFSWEQLVTLVETATSAGNPSTPLGESSC